MSAIVYMAILVVSVIVAAIGERTS